MQTKQEANIQFFKKMASAIESEEHYKDLYILKYWNKRDKMCLAVWKGKRKDPYPVYYYPTKEAREQRISEYKTNSDRAFEEKKRKKETLKNFTPKTKVGDIFQTSWGYEQTNVEYFQVVELLSKRYALVREIGMQTVPERTYSHGMADEVLPDKDNFLDKGPIKVKIQPNIFNNEVASEYFKVGESYKRQASLFKGESSYRSWYY